MFDRDTYPFDLRRGDEVVLGVTVRIICGDLWVVLVDGEEVMATRRELIWEGDTGERPDWFIKPLG